MYYSSMRNATERAASQTSLKKIDTGYYQVSIGSQNIGHVEKNDETGEWEAYHKGCLVGYGRTRAEALQELEWRVDR